MLRALGLGFRVLGLGFGDEGVQSKVWGLKVHALLIRLVQYG